MLVYTSITKSYLPKARVLAKSLKKFHPEWTFVLLYSDDYPAGFDPNNEPFDEILTIDCLGIENWKSWAFGHNVVELCTAVKGPAALHLSKRPNVNRIMYLDPDIKVFSSLGGLDQMLDNYDILLTPHLLKKEVSRKAIEDNEISALKHGVYNLGFFAANTSGQGLDFIQWWSDRLLHYCHDNIPEGLFTDQRWCDLAPAFFDKLGIVRDCGYNVATWNLAHRPITKDDSGRILAGGNLLRFYHFTGYDSGDGFGMLSKYASNQQIAHEVWDAYGKELAHEGNGDPTTKGWLYGHYDNGEAIAREARLTYRMRPDAQKHFPDPYSTLEPSFLSWWRSEAPSQAANPSLLQKVFEGVLSPRRGFKMVRTATHEIKQRGVRSLLLKMLNY